MPSKEIMKSAKEIQEDILRESRIRARLEKLRYLIPHYAREGLSWEQVKLKHLVDDFPQKDQEELQELLFSNYQFSYWEVWEFDRLKASGEIRKLESQDILVVAEKKRLAALEGLIHKGFLRYDEAIGYYIPLTPSLFPVRDIDCRKQYAVINAREEFIKAFILSAVELDGDGDIYASEENIAELREKIGFNGSLESDNIINDKDEEGGEHLVIPMGGPLPEAYLRYLVSIGIKTRKELLERGISEKDIEVYGCCVAKVSVDRYEFDDYDTGQGDLKHELAHVARLSLYRSRILEYLENSKGPVSETNLYRRVLLCPAVHMKDCLLRLIEEDVIEYSHKKKDRYWGIKKPAKVKVGRSEASMKLFESLLTSGDDL